MPDVAGPRKPGQRVSIGSIKALAMPDPRVPHADHRDPASHPPPSLRPLRLSR